MNKFKILILIIQLPKKICTCGVYYAARASMYFFSKSPFSARSYNILSACSSERGSFYDVFSFSALQMSAICSIWTNGVFFDEYV